MRHVAIVGTGLIGSSFALALRKAGFTGEISGVSSPPALEDALKAGAVDRALTLEQAALSADLLYLAQPISRILDTLRKLTPLVSAATLVTDAGSTKHRIVTAGHAVPRFLGGHPMAGRETRGALSADPDLFRGRPYVLCPPEPSAVDPDFREWLERMGARIVILGAEEHDRLVAFSSHLAQLASTALAASLAETAPEAVAVAGPGLIDMTRLALSDFTLWRDIFATNPAAITEALTAYIGKLEHLRENLRTRELQAEFEQAAHLARSLRH